MLLSVPNNVHHEKQRSKPPIFVLLLLPELLRDLFDFYSGLCLHRFTPKTAGLLSDAELGKDSGENFVGSDLAGDGAQMMND